MIDVIQTTIRAGDDLDNLAAINIASLENNFNGEEYPQAILVEKGRHTYTYEWSNDAQKYSMSHVRKANGAGLPRANAMIQMEPREVIDQIRGVMVEAAGGLRRRARAGTRRRRASHRRSSTRRRRNN
jgi:hypothetical protein